MKPKLLGALLAVALLCAATGIATTREAENGVATLADTYFQLVCQQGCGIERAFLFGAR